MQSSTTTLDLRELGCQERHGLVFQCLAALEPGHAVTLINDHEPEPLRQQIASRFRDQFDWTLEQKGQREFHVSICRRPLVP